MPSKKKKYNARFPAGRIKKIMQTDEEVGKVSQHCPIMISRCLELFIESLLSKTVRVTNARNSKTLSPSHMKMVIESEKNFDFLRDLVKDVKDVKDMPPEEENGQNPEPVAAINLHVASTTSSQQQMQPVQTQPLALVGKRSRSNGNTAAQEDDDDESDESDSSD
ncbi:dr1-associated corepressor [Culicoides brevitarsis]|uniref:dr1-associated corepressor n=1 Tax=Culicoides brevitarsis TaxID=469753 RepID=UPI00307BC054